MDSTTKLNSVQSKLSESLIAEYLGTVTTDIAQLAVDGTNRATVFLRTGSDGAYDVYECITPKGRVSGWFIVKAEVGE